MNGQQSYYNGNQKVSFRGGPPHWHHHGRHHAGWGHHGHHHHHYRSPFPGILLFFLAIFIFSKLWWLIFLLPALFFLAIGSKAWKAGAWEDCESPWTVRVETEKRKNNEFYGEDDDYFDDKPKRQSDRDYEII